MSKDLEEELQRIVDAGIAIFTKYAAFIDGPYEGQEREVEYYFKRLTITALDPANRDKDNPIAVKIGDYELIEGTDGQYKWKGWRD